MKKEYKILILIFAFVLCFRLFLVFHTPYFSYDSYFDIRQIDSITESGKPIIHDTLSYGGRIFVFVPVFDYIIAFFNIFLPSFLVFKILPNIFISSLIFIVYLIAKELTKNINVSLLASFVSGFIPVLVTETLNNLSVYTLSIPLIFLSIYLFINIKNKKTTNYFLISVIVLSFIHPSSFILVSGLIFYLILIKSENIKTDKSELELILFSAFFILWTLFIIYKNAFLMHGISIIWQNIPEQVLSLYFSDIHVIKTLLAIGVVPLFYGVYITYRYLFREKNMIMYLLISFVISITLLLWLKLVQFSVGLSLLGIILTLLFSQYYKLFLIRLKNTRFAFYKKYVFYVFVSVFIITSIIPSYYFAKQEIDDSPTNQDIESFLWIKNNTHPDSTILGALDEGHLITKIADRKNVIDSRFIMIKNPSQILHDITRIYQTQSKIESIKLLNHYNIDYILLSDKVRSEFNINEISYVDDSDCFRLVYSEDVKIYRTTCTLETI